MLGRSDPTTGALQPARHELVRLAIPRRTYTQSHMDYALEVIEAVWKRRAAIPGVRISKSPSVLRHFRAEFERLPARVEVPR
jgi:tryptophanase